MFNIFKKKNYYTSTFDLMFVEKLIELLETNPNQFTTIWNSSKTVQSSMLNKHGDIQVMTGYYHIIKPKRINPSPEHIKILKPLIDEIERKDSETVIKRIIERK